MMWKNKLYRFLDRASMKLRREIIKMAGYKIQENYFLDSPFWGSKSIDGIKRVSIYSDHLDFGIPNFLEKKDKFIFSFPRRYIYEISNAIIDPFTGLVYDENGKLIAESSAYDYQRLLLDIPKSTVGLPKHTLKGKYIFLPTITNYYHWLIEDLPPFLGSFQHDKNAKILMGAHDFPPIKDFVKRYLPDEVIKLQSPVRVERLILTGKNAGMGNPISSANIAHPTDLHVLREWFKELLSSNNNGGIKLYLSRSKTKKRNMPGEEKLENELEKLGYIIFYGDMTLFEQIQLFSKASIIVGAQGAAMTNLLWTPKNTKIIEIHYPNKFFPFFYNMAMMLDREYHFLEVPNKSWDRSDIKNITEKIQKIINA